MPIDFTGFNQGYFTVGPDFIRKIFEVCHNDATTNTTLNYDGCCQDTRTAADNDISPKPVMIHLYKICFILDGQSKHSFIRGLSEKSVIDNFWSDARIKFDEFGNWTTCELISCERIN